jgi:hypothetical protein
MENLVNEKSSKLIYLSMCEAYDIIIGNKDTEDVRYEIALYSKEGLEQVLYYFEEIEEYEKCAFIKRIIDQIYG